MKWRKGTQKHNVTPHGVGLDTTTCSTWPQPLVACGSCWKLAPHITFIFQPQTTHAQDQALAEAVKEHHQVTWTLLQAGYHPRPTWVELLAL
jgi:hypothetical protein